jgi:hypothetical protein
MSAPIGVGDILAARAWTVLDDQAAVNTYAFECTAANGAGASDNDLALAEDTIFSPFYKSICPANVVYRGIQVYFLKRLGLLTALAPVDSIAGSGACGAAGNPIARDSAPIFKYNTGLRGPKNRGRVYLPFTATSFQSADGTPTNAFAILVNSLASVLVVPQTIGSGGNTSVVQWVLLHKVRGAVPVSRGAIVNALSANKIGQMHRRGDYGRANQSPI